MSQCHIPDIATTNWMGAPSYPNTSSYPACNVRDVYFPPEGFRFYTCALCLFYLSGLYEHPCWEFKANQTTLALEMLARPGQPVDDHRLVVDAKNAHKVCNQLYLGTEYFDKMCWRLETCCKDAVKCCETQQTARENKPMMDSEACPYIWDGYLCFSDTPAYTMAALKCPLILEKYGGTVYKTCDKNATWVMQTDYEGCSYLKHMNNLNMAGIVCKAVTIVAVVPAFVIMLSFRTLRQQQRIRVHLSLLLASLMVAVSTVMEETLIFRYILTTDPDNVTLLDDNPVWCRLLKLFIEYSYMALFMWMFVEFFHLHRLLVNAFAVPKSLMIYFILGFGNSSTALAKCTLLPYYLFGFGFPFVMVSLFATIMFTSKERNKKCFNYHHNLMWLLWAPSLAALIANLFFMTRIVYILVRQLSPHPNEPSSFRRAVKAVAVMMPPLGVQYLLFIYERPAHGTWQKIYEMCDQILCSLHGALIALVFCYLNKEIQGHMKTPCLRVLRRTGLFHERIANRSMTMSTQYATEHTRPQRSGRLDAGGGAATNGHTEPATLIPLRPIYCPKDELGNKGKSNDEVRGARNGDLQHSVDEATHLDPDSHQQ